MSWEHFAHGADIGVRGIGRTVGEAFEQAALALTAVVTVPEKVESLRWVEIRCAAPDLEILLVDWLNAIVFEMSAQGLLFGRYEVRLADFTLQGRAFGEPVDRERHRPAVEVKGATLTSLLVEQRPDGLWVAQCVVDV